MPTTFSRKSPVSTLVSAVILLALLTSPFRANAKGSTQPTTDPHRIEAGLVGDAIDLSHTWLFHPDDTHDYSSPDLDDRSWPTISADQPFDTYTPPGALGGWYRIHVHLPPNELNLALSIEYFRGSFRIFANGTTLGGFGSMEGNGEDLQSRFANFALPPTLTGSRDLVIAIHTVVRHIELLEPDHRVGLYNDSVVRLGLPEQLSRDRTLYFTQDRLENAVVLSAWTAVLLLAGGLYFELRDHPEFLAVAIEAAALVFWNLIHIYCGEHNIANSHPLHLLVICLHGIEFVAEIEFLRLIVGVPRRPPLVFAEALVLGRYLFQAGMEVLLLPTALSPWIGPIGIVALYGAEIPLLVFGARRHSKDALMLLPPYALFAFADMWFQITRIAGLLGVHNLPSLPNGDLPFVHLSLHDFENGFIVVDILAVLILRTLRIVREQSAIAVEIKAAQTMQRLLLARASAPTPAFHVDSVYHPANQVGGDFFLVSPGPDHSLTAIVGDVSGKGLIAAMRVSMILGVLRREESHDPLVIINQLNRALLNEGGGGFTTACCVRLDRDGHYTLVNAGHIAPFVVGGATITSVEVHTPAALPLGLTIDPEYQDLSGILKSGERMVLMSDGVVEARSAAGELYGFDRLSKLVHLSAHEIASAAQAFGQEDDITVLSIACA